MKIIYVTDLHGETDVFEKVLAKAGKQKVKAIIFGGDLNSHMTLMAVNGIEIQRSFLEDYFIPLIEGFKEENDIEVFAMMGNDDHSMNMDILESADKKGTIKLMHNKVYKLGVGENIDGWTVRDIQSKAVALSRGTESRNLELMVKTSPATDSVPARRQRAPRPQNLSNAPGVQPQTIETRGVEQAGVSEPPERAAMRGPEAGPENIRQPTPEEIEALQRRNQTQPPPPPPAEQ